MGPWCHHIPAGIEESKVGDIDFGSKSVVSVDEIALRWFDRWLKNQPEWWYDLYPNR